MTWRALLFVGSLVSALGCGARSSLATPEGLASPGAGVGANPGSGGAAEGGSGGSGADVRCASLAWLDSAVSVDFPVNDPLARPALVRTSASQFGLGAFSEGATDIIVVSAALSDPFDAWPPTVGNRDVNFPTTRRSALTAFEPGEIGFVASDMATGQLALGGSVPGENGSTFVNLPLPNADVHAAARSGLGAYLVARDFPHSVTVDLFSGYTPAPETTSWGTIACGDELPAASVAPFTNANAFWMATAADNRFEGCASSSGPGRFAQLHHVDVATSELVLHDSYEYEDPIVEIDVATAGDTVWMGVQSADSLRYDIFHNVVANGPLVTLTTELTAATHSIATLGDALAVVQLVPHTSQPGGELRIIVVQPDGSTTTLETANLPPFAVGEPAIATSTDPLAIVIAFVENDDQIVVQRADCE